MKKMILLMILYCSAQTIFAQNELNNTSKIENKSDVLQKSSATNTAVTYDFTTSESKYFGGSLGAAILKINGADTTWGMVAGDANADGAVDAVDKNLFWRVENGTPYLYSKNSDFNLDGNLDVVDKNLFWRPNNGKSTQVPK